MVCMHGALSIYISILKKWLLVQPLPYESATDIPLLFISLHCADYIKHDILENEISNNLFSNSPIDPLILPLL